MEAELRWERTAQLRLRSAAFVVDALVIAGLVGFAAVMGAANTSLPLVLVTFVAYHTALVWLTEATVGKAVFDLRVRRLGRPYVRRLRGLVWVFARASIGYLLCDVFVLGLLVAALHPQRRPLHDLMFNSTVVYGGEPLDRKAVRRRFEGYAERHTEAVEEVNRRHRSWRKLAAWLVTGIAFIDKLLEAFRRAGSWIARRISPPPVQDPPPQAPTSIPSTVKSCLGLATVAASGALWLPALEDHVYEQPSVEVHADRSSGVVPGPDDDRMLGLTGTWEITQYQWTDYPDMAGPPPPDPTGIRFELVQEQCPSDGCPVLVKDMHLPPSDPGPRVRGGISTSIIGLRLDSASPGDAYTGQVDRSPFGCGTNTTLDIYTGTQAITFEPDDVEAGRMSGTYEGERTGWRSDLPPQCPSGSSRIEVEFILKRIP